MKIDTDKLSAAYLLHEDLLYEDKVVEEVGGQAVLELTDLRLRAQVRTLRARGSFTYDVSTNSHWDPLTCLHVVLWYATFHRLLRYPFLQYKRHI